MRIHVEAGFTLDSAGGLLRVNEPGGADAPRFFLGRTAEGNQWWFRHDLGIDLVEALEAICRNEPVPDDLAQPPQGSTEYSRLLDEQAPIQNSWTGPAYRFPDEVPSHSDTVLVTQIDAAVLRPHFEEWLEDPPSCQPFVALLRDGVAVSVCCSVRITSAAHEAGVETPADFQRPWVCRPGGRRVGQGRPAHRSNPALQHVLGEHGLPSGRQEAGSRAVRSRSAHHVSALAAVFETKKANTRSAEVASPPPSGRAPSRAPRTGRPGVPMNEGSPHRPRRRSHGPRRNRPRSS